MNNLFILVIVVLSFSAACVSTDINLKSNEYVWSCNFKKDNQLEIYKVAKKHLNNIQKIETKFSPITWRETGALRSYCNPSSESPVCYKCDTSYGFGIIMELSNEGELLGFSSYEP